MAEAIQWHALDVADVVARLATDREAGLDSRAAAALRARVGDNALPAGHRRSRAALVLGQLRSPLIYLLFGAAAIALALGETTDAAVIAVVVVVNAALGAIQEGRAEQALAALRRLAVQKARVVRDGGRHELDARELVPGDVLLLAAGDAIPADARLVDGTAVQVAEAALTGESVPVAKGPAPLPAGAALAERTNMLYAGTHVTAGRARAVVVATGGATEIGHIATLAEHAGTLRTPLERRVETFGRWLMVAAAALLAVFLAAGLVAGLPLAELAMVGISQVVGLVPEGLPVAMTVALAVGVQRMARRRAIVRRLSAVETLGATTVICSDKTGTLTRNEMTVTELWLPGAGAVEVTGIGYQPDGELRRGGAPVTVDEVAGLRRLLEAAALCNDAHVLGPGEREPRWRVVGDPTEAALVTLALKAGLAPDLLRATRPRTDELPFDATTKMMATAHGGPTPSVIVKGAAEAILPLCAPGTPVDDLLAADHAMAARALRVLAFAELDGATLAPGAGPEALRGRATFLGLAGQLDPPRAEAVGAVAACLAAGIRPVMVTGDHQATGLAIAHTLGIAREGDLAVDGSRLDDLSDDALAAQLDRVRVFARVRPEQKLRIVLAYQRRGEVVAVTGDGVNDAPALARADVGVAMGSGTDVAKEAAKIVVTDDDFGSIVAAVEEGRVVYRNIKKAVLLLASTSFAEALILLIAVMLGYPPPFAAVQILWNNLVTEGVITVNLIMDPPAGDEMQRPPIATGEALITREMWRRVAVMTPTIVVVTLGWFIARTSMGAAPAVARTESFTLLAVCEWFNVLNCLSDRRSALHLDVLRSPWLLGGLVLGNALQLLVVYAPALSSIFHTVPIELHQALAIGAAASLVLWVEEVRKWIARRRAPLTRRPAAAR